MDNSGFVDAALLARVRVGREYVAAKYGFRNHWYPALFGHELAEGQARPVTLLGENILLKRIDGRVHAIHDRCLHRGVPLSRKLECYTAGTVTCWYHGFTYRFADGVLCDIAGTAGSAVIGRRKLRTYPVSEAQGLVFVFVGDADHTPPPLAHDVPPGFLDAELAVHGKRRVVAANWRIGCENGFDSTHIFIHKDSVLIAEADLALPLGLQPLGRHAFQRQLDDDGPKGVFDNFGPDEVRPVFTATIEGEEVLHGAIGGSNRVPQDISMWLPCALRVRPWPVPETTQFEWYVPIDADHHLYLQTLGKRCTNERERDDWAREFHARWLPKALDGFNDDDVWAREATQPFYADDTGWLEEQLFEPDGNIVEWRKLASAHARGIQRPEHIDPPGHTVLSVD
ncbi:MAG: Rieske 2Fe-2S domain-containing protein [Gammaproteobacteria bacterium]|nr:Rieske 2Fe-2S domain-containing protein [Gammaproteobacteria bacterium]